MAGVWSSIRYLLADFIGDEDGAPPFLPDGLPEAVVPVASEGIERLIDYQGAGYAQLYVDRLKRFVGRRGVDDALFGEIARLMAQRMSYDDPIRIAQTKLAELEPGAAKPTARSRQTTSKNSAGTSLSKRFPPPSPSPCSACSTGGDGCTVRSRSASAPPACSAFAG